MTDQQIRNNQKPGVLDTAVRSVLDALITICFVSKMTEERAQGYQVERLARNVGSLTGLNDVAGSAENWTSYFVSYLLGKNYYIANTPVDRLICLEFTSVGRALVEPDSVDGIPVTSLANFRPALGVQFLPKYRVIAEALRQCGKPSPLFEWLAMTPRDLSLQLAN